MKFVIIFSLLFISICLVYNVKPEIQQRTFMSLIKKIFRYPNTCDAPCPPWHCQDDSAVIHGYCCGCPGSEYDNVPVPCYPDLKCLRDMRQLCRDYNFMMDCCCTGP